MSVHIDRTYLLRISAKLPRFTRKRDDLYNFRCPLCGDSTKNPTKSRGYIYRKNDSYFYTCYNCGVGTTFFGFLERVEPSLVPEYSMERFRDNTLDLNPVVKPKIFKNGINLPTISSLPNNHKSKEYVVNRQIPLHHYSHLYYSQDFAKFVEEMGVEKELRENEERIVIPFYDKDGNLTGFQGRDLGDSKIRYISIRLKEDSPMVFGLADIDITKRVYVFEGPFDSMFIDNAIAVASSGLETAIDIVPKENAVLVYDNEPRNKEILKLMSASITKHFNVVIWPQMIKEKDINDMILSGLSKDDLEDILETNTFINLRAEVEFTNWKKN